MRTKLLTLVLLLVVCTACSQADIASANISKEADQFKIQRKCVFYNGFTDSYIAVVEGLCSLGNNDILGELTVTCRTSENTYVKHFLGLADNVTYFCLQLEAVPVDPYHHKVIWRPETILPDIELDTSGSGQ